MSGMGYGMGTDDAMARRKARLAARYGTAAPTSDEPEPVAWSELSPAQKAWDELEQKRWDGVAATLPETISAQAAPKKKGGRPKGSKNKRAE